MATNYKHAEDLEEEEDEGYIDMDLSSFSSNLFLHSVNTSSNSQQDIEFEFISNDQISEATIFPADELFYKGKLLPLHLPPRLQMLQNLLQATTTTTTSLAQSCNIVSPSESFRSTSDHNQLNDNFIVGDIPKKSWPKKKLKLIKKLLGGQTYRAHLKSLFSKSSRSNETFDRTSANKGLVSKGESDYLNLNSNHNVGFEDPFNVSHRRSFCGEIKQHFTIKRSYSPSLSSSCSSCSSSSSFSFDTNGVGGLDLHKMRSCSSGSDTEGSIDAAIAHCKKSQ